MQPPAAASTLALETNATDCCNEEPPRDDPFEGQSCEHHDGRHEEELRDAVSSSSYSSSSHCLQQLSSSASFMAMSMSMKELTSPCGLLRRLSLTNIACTTEASSSAAPPTSEAEPLPSSLSNPSCDRTTIRPITRSSFDCLRMPDLPDFMVDQMDCGDNNTGSRLNSCVGTEGTAASAAAGASPPRSLHAREDRRRKSATAATFDYLATALRLSL